MKSYQVTKIDSSTEKEINYGINPEEDVKLITRGYKQDKSLPEIYDRIGNSLVSKQIVSLSTIHSIK